MSASTTHALLVVCTIALAALVAPARSAEDGPIAFERARQGFQDMASDWKRFREVFAEDAKLKHCAHGECRQGSFDDIFGPFQNSVSMSMYKMTSLTDTSNADCLVHWSQYIETESGCEAVWTGYSTFEFDPDGKVQRLVTFTDDSDALAKCLPAFHVKNRAAEIAVS